MSLLALASAVLSVALATPAAPTADRLAVGDPAPALTAEHWVKGEAPAELERGTVYVVEFWATWCAPCIAAFPHLSELQEKWADDVVVLSVSDEPLTVVERFLEKEKHASVTRYTMGTDPDRSMHVDWMEAAGRNGIPCTFIVDREGIIQYIGHPMGMDRALERVVTGQEPAGSVSGGAEVDLTKYLSVEGEHEAGAVAATAALRERLTTPGSQHAFEQSIVLEGALKMGGPDGEGMDLKVTRKGTLQAGGARGLRVESTRTMDIPGMPGGMGEEETLLADDERLRVKRVSSSPFAPAPYPRDSWYEIGRDELAELGGEAPMPLPLLVMMDPSPALSSPVDLLDRLVEGSALAVVSDADGTVVLEGRGAPFLGIPGGGKIPEDSDGDGTPDTTGLEEVPVRLTLAAERTELVLGDAAKPVFRMVLERLEDVEVDPDRFSTGEERVDELAPVLRDRMEMMRSMGGGR